MRTSPFLPEATVGWARVLPSLQSTMILDYVIGGLTKGSKLVGGPQSAENSSIDACWKPRPKA